MCESSPFITESTSAFSPATSSSSIATELCGWSLYSQAPSYPALQIIDYIVQLDHISVLRHLCMKRYYPVSHSIIMHHKVMHAEYVFVKVQYHLLKSIDKLRLRLCSKQRVYRLLADDIPE